MNDKIGELAEQLSAEIQTLESYEEYLDAVEAYENDSEAQKKLSEVRKVENELIAAHEKEEPHEEHSELHDEFETLYDELLELSVVKEYHESAEKLEEELNDINSLISEDLHLDFAKSSINNSL